MTVRSKTVALALALTALVAKPAHADEPATTPEPAPETVPGNVYVRPHRSIVTLGVVLFGGAYLSSVVAASASARPSDRWLFVPVGGSWIDLARRDCTGRPCGPDDDVAKSFLVASALLQTAGVAITVWGLLVPEVIETRVPAPKSVPKSGPESVTVAPVGFANGAGVAALGAF